MTQYILKVKQDEPITEEQAQKYVSDFLKKVHKQEMMKMKDVKMCPIYSTMAVVPGKVSGTLEPTGIQGMCYKEKCGWWSLCPANDDSILKGLITDIAMRNMAKSEDNES